MTAREFIIQEGLAYKLLEYDGMQALNLESGVTEVKIKKCEDMDFLGIDEKLLEEKLEEYHQLKSNRQ